MKVLMSRLDDELSMRMKKDYHHRRYCHRLCPLSILLVLLPCSCAVLILPWYQDVNHSHPYLLPLILIDSSWRLQLITKNFQLWHLINAKLDSIDYQIHENSSQHV